jgi:lysophospholipase L1-like esterase
MATRESPFELVVLGDSVTWGSGLPEEGKWWSLVRGWLELKLGRPVHPQVLAHSLAVIVPDPSEDPKPPAWGEIRFKYPSITYQALSDPRLSVPGPDAIDLVVVDGGINDLGPANLLLPWRSPQWVRDEAAEFCGRRMKNLLLQMLDRFPRARVIVTGYYPIVSSQTSFTGALAPLLPFRQRVIDLSTAWRQATDQWLEWAVQEANLHPGGPRPRVLYANAEFKPEHSYGAPNTHLWMLQEALTDGSALGKQRRSECRRLKPLDPICPIDMAFHPNRLGAQAYADAVMQVLGPLLPALA